MVIAPAHLASSLGALDSVDVEQALGVALQQALGSVMTLLQADRAGLMLVDQAGALRWASAADRVVEARPGDLSVPVQVGGGPVGTLDVYVAARRDWDDSKVWRPARQPGGRANRLIARKWVATPAITSKWNTS